MKTAYQIIRKPVITEKGLGIKENQNTLVFQVAPKATKTEIKEAVQSIFKVKVSVGAHGELSGKRAAAGQVCRLPSGLEEGVRADCGPARRCRSTRRICKNAVALSRWPTPERRQRLGQS